MAISHAAHQQIDAAVPGQAADVFALQLRLAALSVLLIPVNWLLGTTLLWVFAVAAVLVRQPLRGSPVEWCCLFLAAALLLGFGVAIGVGSVPADRLIGPLFNAAIIALFAAFFTFARKAQAYRRPGDAPADRIYRAAFWCFAIQILIVAASAVFVAATGENEVSFPTLLGIAGDLPGILEFYSSNAISIRDGFELDAEPRIVGVGIYPTEGAILVLTVGLLAAIHTFKRRRFALTVLVELAIVAALIAMASRTTLAAYLVSLGLLFALGGRRLVGVLLLSSPVIAFAVLIAAIYGPDLIGQMFELANQSRADSSATRFTSYTLALGMVLETNPLTGLGILPRIESLLEIPIGSHSSWTSILTRGGFLALSVWIVLNGLLMARLVRSQWRLYADSTGLSVADRFELVNLSRCVLVVMAWWVTEDFDFPAHHAVVAALSLGLFWGLMERIGSGGTLNAGAGGTRFAPPIAASGPSRRDVPDWHKR